MSKQPPIDDLINGAQPPANVVPIDPKRANKTTPKPPKNPTDSAEWTSKNGDYEIKHGAFLQLKPTRSGGDDGILRIQLCDFSCEIIEEISSDTGLEEKNLYRIQGKQNTGQPLQAVDIPITKFNAGSWFDVWGSRALVYAGTTKRDNLRVAITEYSRRNGAIPTRRTYAYTGWKKIDSQWHYLTGSGAITANGLNEAMQVDLGAGHMQRYNLPAPPAVKDLRQHAPAVINDLLAICPNRPEIGAALLAAVARAPLGECHPTDFALFIHGQTGSMKSTITALAQGFYGDFTARSFPANFSDTDNDMECKGFQAKDAIYTIDDFKPAVSPAESLKLHAKAERLIRNTGNQAGRGRRNSDMAAKAAPFNRSMTLITGEELPKGQSLLARLLVMELSKGDVHIDTLNQLQQVAKQGVLRQITAAYLQWMTGQLDRLKSEFPHNVTTLRDGTLKQTQCLSHSRAPEMYANLVAGIEVFYDFLEDSGVLDSTAKNTHLSTIEQALTTAFETQASYQREQDEVERFKTLLNAVLNNGDGYIANRIDQSPPPVRPHSWGWVKDSEGKHKCNGKRLGWFCQSKAGVPDQIWLLQDAVFAAIQNMASQQREPLVMSAQTLWRRMEDKGLILETEKQGNGKTKTTMLKTVAGAKERVMILSAEWLKPGQSENIEEGISISEGSYSCKPYVSRLLTTLI